MNQLRAPRLATGVTTRITLRLATLGAAIGAVALSLACEPSTAPARRDWFEGSWSALSANDSRLPWRYSSIGRPYSVDSMRLVLDADPFVTSLFAIYGTRPEPLTSNVVGDVYRRSVTVQAWPESVTIRAEPDGTYGRLYAHFVRRGDTLVLPGYVGAEWKLVATRR